MIRIISDTSTLYSPKEGAALGIDIAPLFVNINGASYRELEEIKTPRFIEMIDNGGIPSSSQPAIGDVLDLYQRYPGDQILNLTMADGLSGTYDSACSARTMADHPENITVVNTRTLCGPHRYLVQLARKLAEENRTLEEILARVRRSMDNSFSFLIPQDFDFLKRGGRLSPLVAEAGKLLNLVPVMTLSQDCRRLVSFAKKRSFSKAIKAVSDFLAEKNTGSSHRLYITHAGAEDLAEAAGKALREAFPCTDLEVLELSPVFTAQGGPRCVAVQSILK